MANPLSPPLVQSDTATPAALAALIQQSAHGEQRHITAIAGPPGSGKSTLAEKIVEALNNNGANAVLMPMDGFHLDNRLLEPMNLLPRKGSPETFDFQGFYTTIGRIRKEPSVYLPVFDRSREIAIAAAAEIAANTQFVVVEGNYLLLDESPWNQLQSHWDFSIYLEVPEAELERRLIDRWLGHGYSPEEANAKARQNDLLNAQRVARAIGSHNQGVIWSPD